MTRSSGTILLARFWSKVLKTQSCWIWQAAKTHNGYGRVKIQGHMYLAHRLAYELERGPIETNLTIDHTCRTPACVNPDHLEQVSMRENVLRGKTITAKNAAKTHCYRGHPLSGANLFIRKNGRRRCRACEKATQKRIRATSAYRIYHARAERFRRAM